MSFTVPSPLRSADLRTDRSAVLETHAVRLHTSKTTAAPPAVAKRVVNEVPEPVAGDPAPAVQFHRVITPLVCGMQVMLTPAVTMAGQPTELSVGVTGGETVIDCSAVMHAAPLQVVRRMSFAPAESKRVPNWVPKPVAGVPPGADQVLVVTTPSTAGEQVNVSPVITDAGEHPID